MKKINIIGIGPGEYRKMTLEAIRALEEAQVIVGYDVYIDLIREHFPEKEFLSTPMRQEIERCKLAFAKAEEGRTVGFICSGDAGVYGMAELLYEIGKEHEEVELQVIAGVTAALSGAALLGAPLIHDFALISLSDLLTPMDKIKKRLRAAAEGDFVIVLYNPSSKKRADYLKRACDVLLEYKPEDTACGYVRNIGREGQEVRTMPLFELKNAMVDMFTTVFIGNSQTKRYKDKLLTPRGYPILKENEE